jgi:pimeloyl-ACP methyl ester carboxylesterase
MTRLTTYAHDGLTFDVRDTGPLDGDPVVLLHGFPERSSSWRSVAPLLHEAGLRTYAPDQRGYSPGARPRRRRDHTISLLVGDVVALVEEIGRPVHLVGHDWGAVVAWSVAIARPDLVRSLTAVSVPHPAAYLKASRSSSQILKSWYTVAFQLPFGVEWLARSGRLAPLLRRGGMSASDVARFQTEMVEDGAVRGGVMWYRAVPFGGMPGGACTVPTTFVWSDGDSYIGRSAAELCPRWVTGPYEYVELPGVSHWVPTQAPDALAAAILARIGSVA